MSVVRRDAVRRWSLVGAGVAALSLLPAVVAAWPVGTAAAVDAAQLRERVLASVDQPYEGYVATDGRLGLPALPELEDIGGLLGGSSRVRAWYAGPDSWRFAELTPVGERDTYRTVGGLYRWDFERNLVTLLAGEPTIWLPGAADLVPPALGRQLLATEGRLEQLPTRRVAGIAAAGVRLVPDDPDAAVGRVDVWADPATGLPLRVEIGRAGSGGDSAGRGESDSAFTSRFLQLRQAAPDEALLRPTLPVGAGFVETTVVDVRDALREALPGKLPATLAGRARASHAATAGVAGGAVYGTGFSSLVVLGLPGGLGGQTIDASRDAGGTPVPVTGAEAYELRASLLTALVVHADHAERGAVHAWLLVGLVNPQALRDAAADLVDAP
jgi:hypothetical protein